MELLLTDIIITFLPFMAIIVIAGIISELYSIIKRRVNRGREDRSNNEKKSSRTSCLRRIEEKTGMK